MTQVALTGAGGFLGWHTRAAIRARGESFIGLAVGDSFDSETARSEIQRADRVIHLAGVNRGSDAEVYDGNLLFAQQLSDALRGADRAPEVIVFANSVQALDDSVYGEAKRRSAEVLARACHEVGTRFEDVLLPNIFGEHGRPFYNSVFATFATQLAEGGTPAVQHDRALQMLHAQDAADLLVGDATEREIQVRVRESTVAELLSTLTEMSEVYRRGEIPDISTPWLRNVFNSYRSYTAPATIPILLARHADERGSFFEVLRSHGGAGQSSFSTTAPAVTRGDHFHRRKVERFVVLAGDATISLRKLFTDQVISIAASGRAPVAVDMPTMWSHNITNIGETDLYTAFWTDDLFDPDHPDTVAEAV